MTTTLDTLVSLVRDSRRLLPLSSTIHDHAGYALIAAHESRPGAETLLRAVLCEVLEITRDETFIGKAKALGMQPSAQSRYHAPVEQVRLPRVCEVEGKSWVVAPWERLDLR